MIETRIIWGLQEFCDCFWARLRTNKLAQMATCLGFGSPGRCHGYSVMQEIIRLVDNEFLAILVMGDSTLL